MSRRVTSSWSSGKTDVGYVTPGKAAGTPVTVKAGEVTDVGEIKLDPK